jgi:hypothetical protein
MSLEKLCDEAFRAVERTCDGSRFMNARDAITNIIVALSSEEQKRLYPLLWEGGHGSEYCAPVPNTTSSTSAELTYAPPRSTEDVATETKDDQKRELPAVGGGGGGGSDKDVKAERKDLTTRGAALASFPMPAGTLDVEPKDVLIHLGVRVLRCYQPSFLSVFMAVADPELASWLLHEYADNMLDEKDCKHALRFGNTMPVWKRMLLRNRLKDSGAL